MAIIRLLDNTTFYKLEFRVSRLLVELGWFDFDLDFPPPCPAAQQLLPNSHKLRQNWAENGTLKIQVKQMGHPVDKCHCHVIVWFVTTYILPNLNRAPNPRAAPPSPRGQPTNQHSGLPRRTTTTAILPGRKEGRNKEWKSLCLVILASSQRSLRKVAALLDAH